MQLTYNINFLEPSKVYGTNYRSMTFVGIAIMSDRNSKGRSDVEWALLRLPEAATDLRQNFVHAAELDNLPKSDDDGETENEPLFSLFLSDKASPVPTCCKLVHFTLDEFRNLHDLVHDSVVRGMVFGESTKMFGFYQTFFCLRYWSYWSMVVGGPSLRQCLKIVSTFEKMMTRLVISIVTELEEGVVDEIRKEWYSMATLNKI